ncbi:ribonuclease H-like protein [Ascodesmis nigricans]|uniref:Ribonuclease H-like protein n=1 Tax=Ascodesmis nigricans TaxID=341454 RepID=A0A4S2MKU5_9PEZI|nr:ribonuclease H-like protein [Ascodesmis nigricans]
MATLESVPKRLLSTLKATQLRTLNRCMGFTVAGTKPTLIQQLLTMDYRTPRTLLSIDMGVKNLSYCVLSPSHTLTKHNLTFKSHAWRHEALEVPKTPTAFAALAKATVTRLLEKYPNVDTILIERQRWRSHGSNAVLQHTIHCNTFEAMLHACFLCLMDSEAQAIRSVDPSAVANYNGTVGKREREVLLRGMLASGEVVVKGDTEQWDTPPRRANNTIKRDDLVDCLVQAVTWMRWQENRRVLLEEGSMPEEAVEAVVEGVTGKSTRKKTSLSEEAASEAAPKKVTRKKKASLPEEGSEASPKKVTRKKKAAIPADDASLEAIPVKATRKKKTSSSPAEEASPEDIPVKATRKKKIS